MKLCTHQQQILNWMNVTLRLFQMKKLHWTDFEFDRTYFLYGYLLVERLRCGDLFMAPRYTQNWKTKITYD